MQELVGDVGKDRGAARGDSALGHQRKEAGQEFAKVLGGGEVSVAAEEVFGEVSGVTRGRRYGGGLQMEMIGTRAGLGFQAWATAALAIGEAMQTAGARGRGARCCAGGLGLRA